MGDSGDAHRCRFIYMSIVGNNYEKLEILNHVHYSLQEVLSQSLMESPIVKMSISIKITLSQLREALAICAGHDICLIPT
jgi:hypothetical protein